jgi:hypothetical protein
MGQSPRRVPAGDWGGCPFLNTFKLAARGRDLTVGWPSVYDCVSRIRWGNPLPLSLFYSPLTIHHSLPLSTFPHISTGRVARIDSIWTCQTHVDQTWKLSRPSQIKTTRRVPQVRRLNRGLSTFPHISTAVTNPSLPSQLPQTPPLPFTPFESAPPVRMNHSVKNYPIDK